ncbi:IclR family transcriptional regulator [Intrasporangium oryzae NRRL B-24470]|uniref:IclR family transcriptional regulator n=1 Tax=Intrasporangium oryzae NRRL B-24470 TaxID=1386089 RepID=W9G4A4_9MICO|nr:helix-turn-helix domain-containing protein [Intrasporangium oryzae]EWT00971.1 IclR family transcriptional regulator [Intrasporangium oryzae NRRL B-24470]
MSLSPDRATAAASSAESGGGRPESSKTLDRGVRLLEVLARPATTSLTITELAAELGVGRPAVYRLVATLADHQLVARQPDGRVRLGIGVSRLAAAVTPVVRNEARPILRALADDVGATAHLTIAEGDEALALVVVEPSWTDFHVAYRSGARHRLDQGAAGRAILAGRAGRTGLVATDGELQAGAHGLALPIATAGAPGAPGGAVEASVGVVSLQPLDPALIGPALHRAALALAAVLR